MPKVEFQPLAELFQARVLCGCIRNPLAVSKITYNAAPVAW